MKSSRKMIYRKAKKKKYKIDCSKNNPTTIVKSSWEKEFTFANGNWFNSMPSLRPSKLVQAMKKLIISYTARLKTISWKETSKSNTTIWAMLKRSSFVSFAKSCTIHYKSSLKMELPSSSTSTLLIFLLTSWIKCKKNQRTWRS